MKSDEICFDKIYWGLVVGCDKRQKCRVISVLSRTATVQLLDSDETGVVALADLKEA